MKKEDTLGSDLALRDATQLHADGFGCTFANMGDRNGDGISEIIVGAYTDASGRPGEKGALYYLEVAPTCPPPSPPPSPGVVVSVTFTVDMPVDEFHNQSSSFVSALAGLVRVPSFNIAIVDVSPGSTVVSTTILQRDGGSNVEQTLLGYSLAELTVGLGMSVLDVIIVRDAPPSASSSTGGKSSSSGDNGSMSTSPSVAATASPTLVAGASGGGVASLTAMLFLIFRWRRRRLRAANSAKLIESALASNDAFAFPLHVLRANDFLQMGQLVVFEDARTQGKHEVVDLVSDARNLFGQQGKVHLVFLSHQWLAFGAPGASPSSHSHSADISPTVTVCPLARHRDTRRSSQRAVQGHVGGTAARGARQQLESSRRPCLGEC